MAEEEAHGSESRSQPGRFTTAVRLNRVAQPSHVTRFSEADWTKAFGALSPHSAYDDDLYSAGLWFASRFAALAIRARALALRPGDLDSIVRMQCGAANRASTFIGRMTLSPDEESKLVTSDDIISGRYRDPNTGASSHPADLLEASIGGLKYALDNLRLHEKNAPPSGRTQKPEELTTALRGNTILGIYWDALVGAWNDCVWNGWRVDSSGKVDVVTCPADFIEGAKAVSRYRQDNLMLEATHHAARAWQSTPDEVRHQAFSDLVSSVEGSGKGRRFIFGSPADPDHPPRGVTVGVVSETLYFQGMLELELPKLRPLTLRGLVDAWEALAALASALALRARGGDAASHPKRLLEWAPTLTRDELTEAIRRRVRCSVESASTLLRCLVRSDAEFRDELWFRPVVELRSGKFLLVNDALVHANLQRSIEYWAKLGGLDLAARGPLFEEFARREVAQAIQASDALRDARVAPRSIVVEFANGLSEQIDLVLRLGSQVLIGEAKCILYPATQHDEHNYYGTLAKAARQAKRKARACQDDAVTAIPQLAVGTVSAADARFAPFVLVSTPLGVGLVNDAVPTVDLRVLCRYFAPGWIEHMVVVRPDGQQVGGTRKPFYSDRPEAESSIVAYLNTPPQLALVTPRLSYDFRPMPIIDAAGKPFGFRSRAVAPFGGTAEFEIAPRR